MADVPATLSKNKLVVKILGGKPIGFSPDSKKGGEAPLGRLILIIQRVQLF